MNKDVLKDLTYGMYVISTKYNGKDVGCFVNTVSQITAQDVVISVSVNKENFTNKAIKESKIFAVSILSCDSTPDVIGKFGFFSSEQMDKFSEFKTIEEQGIKVIDEKICGYLICELIQVVDIDTHDVFIAKVKNMVKMEDKGPMTYDYYHTVIKGKAPKKAPTYIEEIVDNSIKYKCEICGYIHDESKEKIKFEDLPDDWKCPICGVGKETFTKI
ncbi:MAG: flavin reductase [Clostridia bacterium]|nr:flavin reductase [Clostridia bacterium]